MRVFSGAMPEMQNFDCFTIRFDTVVNAQRRIKKASDVGVSLYWSSDVRVGSKQIEVVKKVIRESVGRFRMLLS
jgi:hypothetical protein